MYLFEYILHGGRQSRPVLLYNTSYRFETRCASHAVASRSNYTNLPPRSVFKRATISKNYFPMAPPDQIRPLRNDIRYRSPGSGVPSGRFCPSESWTTTPSTSVGS